VDYLYANLLPLMDEIEGKPTDSDVLGALGLGDRSSTQSIVIQFGNKIEMFWNKVFSDYAINHIEDSDRIMVDGEERQIDHFFSTPTNDYYLESKCNLNFDSEKVKASNKKVGKVVSAINTQYGTEANAGYFVPVLDFIPDATLVKYNNKGVDVYAVSDVFDLISDIEFTKEEYFSFLEDVVGPLLLTKGL
jgi:hypothetical protein